MFFLSVMPWRRGIPDKLSCILLPSLLSAGLLCLRVFSADILSTPISYVLQARSVCSCCILGLFPKLTSFYHYLKVPWITPKQKMWKKLVKQLLVTDQNKCTGNRKTFELKGGNVFEWGCSETRQPWFRSPELRELQPPIETIFNLASFIKPLQQSNKSVLIRRCDACWLGNFL